MITDRYEEPIRFLQERIQIVWNHGGNRPAFKITITVMGKYQACIGSDKLSCMSIGREPWLCISDDLACDGIRHCPSGDEYNNDEDAEMCERKRLKTLHTGVSIYILLHLYGQHFLRNTIDSV